MDIRPDSAATREIEGKLQPYTDLIKRHSEIIYKTTASSIGKGAWEAAPPSYPLNGHFS